MKGAAALVIAAVLALGSAGCGGGTSDGRLSKSQYQAKLHSLSRDLSAGLQSFAAFQPTDLAAAPAFLSKIADTLAGVAGTLKGVKPPHDVQTLHDELIDGATRAATELRKLATGLRGASRARMEELLAQFDPGRLSGLLELEQAAAGLAAKGYHFSST